MADTSTALDAVLGAITENAGNAISPEYLHALAALHETLAFEDDDLDDDVAEQPKPETRVTDLRLWGADTGTESFIPAQPSNVTRLRTGVAQARLAGRMPGARTFPDYGNNPYARSAAPQSNPAEPDAEMADQLAVAEQQAKNYQAASQRQSAKLAELRRSLRESVLAVDEKNDHIRRLESRISEQREQLAQLNSGQSAQIEDLKEQLAKAEKAHAEQMRTDATSNLELTTLRGIIAVAFPADGIKDAQVYGRAWEGLREYAAAVQSGKIDQRVGPLFN